jgi:putative ABC transport system substrate-binding protein
VRPGFSTIAVRAALAGALTLGFLAAPLVVKAQPAGKVYRLGYLSDRLGPGTFEEAFLRGLRELGYVQGRNIVIEYRWAEGKVERLPANAGRLAGASTRVPPSHTRRRTW